MILQTFSNIWIRKPIFYSFIKNVSLCYRQVKPSNYFTHHNLTSSARVINLCCSTSVNDFATNEVIDMFDFLVFNNCSPVRFRLDVSLTVIFTSVFTWKVGFAYGAVNPAFYFLRWMKTWPLVVDTNPCISVVIFFSSSWKSGGLSPTSTKLLHAVDASWLTFF